MYSEPNSAIWGLSTNLHSYSCGFQWSNLLIKMLKGRMVELDVDKYLPRLLNVQNPFGLEKTL